jgi:TonB family protein
MSDIWREWIGQTVDERFPLQQYLAHTEHSAVFLTEVTDTDTRKGTIKFISADAQDIDHQLQLWSQVAQLDHPGLLKVFHAGRCRITDMDLLYVVTEHADENLAQILPQRALTPDETQQMLEPIVAALLYLHNKGMAHAHVKPSNVLAVGDFLKLSSDTIVPVGETVRPQRERDVYDPPESGVGSVTTQGDIWSLGQLVVETLTQQTAALPFNDKADPIVPEFLPQPFEDIALHALRRDPSRRWTSADIAHRLSPKPVFVSPPQPQGLPIAVAAAAGATAAAGAQQTTASASVPPPPVVPPPSVPLSHEPAVPLDKMQIPVRGGRSYSVPPATPRARRELTEERDFVLPGYVVPLLLAGTLLLIVVLAVPRLFKHQTKEGPNAPAPAASLAANTKSNDPAGTSSNAVGKNSAPVLRSEKPTAPVTRRTADVSSSPSAVPPDVPPAKTSDSAAAKVPATDTLAALSARTSSGSVSEKGEVLNQVLPTASQTALSTIHGTVRVTVRAKVDPVGRVSDAELFAPGPSKYFAERALVAARQWEFSSPEANGHSMPSEWLIRFEFSQSGPKAFPTQTAP